MSRTYSDILYPNTPGPRETDAKKSDVNNSPSNVVKSSRTQENDCRTRINVGWYTTQHDIDDADAVDKNIVGYTSHVGQANYNFIAFPLGGAKRGFWRHEKDGSGNLDAPGIDLPDMQLANHLWETYVVGVLSPWIDCDSGDEASDAYSEQELMKELNYASYMGLRTIVIDLKRADSPRLVKIINKYLWTKPVIFTVWVVVPTTKANLQCSDEDNRDVWSVWADFRKMCANYNSVKLQVAINLTPDMDDEFTDLKLVQRWKGEPVQAIIINSDVFVGDRKDGSATIQHAHSELMRTLWVDDSMRALVRSVNCSMKNNIHLMTDFAREIRSKLKDLSYLQQREAKERDGPLAAMNVDYFDVLQTPLQPLSDNLDSGVYNTFEQDPIKYRKYREAVQCALKDLGESESRPNSLVVYVVGAGRGPLVTKCFEAESMYNNEYRKNKTKLKINMVVVEKNPNAIVTLRYMNEKAWMNRARIIESDMRSLASNFAELGLQKPDIVVSELLGSFGDNELSPECLDPLTDCFKETTINIPHKYTSYCGPLMSLKLNQSIQSNIPTFYTKGIQQNRREHPMMLNDGSYEYSALGNTISPFDQLYVVYPRKACPLGATKPVFTFEHPNWERTSNERDETIEFKIDRTGDLMGFACYFHMVLYKDVILSIEPSTHSKGMISWFPAILPLRQIVRVNEGDDVVLEIKRKVDDEGVWYEWRTENRKIGEIATDWQNVHGESYYMRKNIE